MSFVYRLQKKYAFDGGHEGTKSEFNFYPSRQLSFANLSVAVQPLMYYSYCVFEITSELIRYTSNGPIGKLGDSGNYKHILKRYIKNTSSSKTSIKYSYLIMQFQYEIL